MTKERIEKEIWDKNYYIKIQIIDAILFIEFNAIATRSRVTFHKLRYVSNYVTNFLSQFHGSQTISIFHRAETVPPLDSSAKTPSQGSSQRHTVFAKPCRLMG